MKTEAKTVLLLVGTLVLGMVIGFFGHGVFMRDQFKRQTRHMRTPDGFVHRFLSELNPTEEQREAIQEILKKHYEEMAAYREAFRPKMEAMRKELDAILTDEQKKTLDEKLLKKRNGGSFGGRRDKGKGEFGRGMRGRPDSKTPPPPPPGAPHSDPADSLAW